MIKRAFVATLLAAVAFVLVLHAQQRRQGPPEAVSYAPKPNALTAYTPPHKPHTKLADVKAKHKGEAEWSEWVVKDDYLWSQYIQSAPHSKVSPRFHPDTREWWVILEGEIRFTIEGQEPFVARRRSMVQVPPQTIYSMETVSDQPALRFETNIPNATTLFPEAPKTAPPGIDFIPVRLTRKPFPYGHENKPHVNLDELAAADPNTRGGRFVHDDRAVANIIYGYNSKLPPLNEKDRGHYHPECAEYWLIMLGQIRYPIEGQGVVIASEGDVVYVPKNTFHAPRWWGGWTQLSPRYERLSRYRPFAGSGGAALIAARARENDDRFPIPRVPIPSFSSDRSCLDVQVGHTPSEGRSKPKSKSLS